VVNWGSIFGTGRKGISSLLCHAQISSAAHPASHPRVQGVHPRGKAARA